MYVALITICIVFPFDFVCCIILGIFVAAMMSPYYFQNVSTSKGSCCSQITAEVLQATTEGKNQHFVRISKAMFILYQIAFTSALKHQGRVVRRWVKITLG